MKKIKIPNGTAIFTNKSVQGEFLETKIARIISNNEPITDGAPIIYTERKDGVLPATDIRTDRFDVAIDAMDIASKSNSAKREERIKNKKIAENLAKGLDADGKPIQDTKDDKNV